MADLNTPIPGPDEDPAKRTNAEQPRGVAGGVIETVKRAVMIALQEQLQTTTLDDVNPTDVSVEMEYPMEPENYPGVWVQFSFKQFVNSGVGMELINPVKDDQGNVTGWETIREFTFTGTVTLSIMALTNLERDRLADSIVTALMFAREPQHVLTKPEEDTKQFRSLLTSLAANPYVSMTVNTDQITPGGQSVTPGVPWDEALPGYEDTYSFDILGQTNIVFRHDGTYTLRATTLLPEEPPQDPFDWH